MVREVEVVESLALELSQRSLDVALGDMVWGDAGVAGGWWDWVMLKVFSNPDDSGILWSQGQ